MEEIQIEKDIPLICVRAHSFPEGIQDAFTQLSQQFEIGEECFGIFQCLNDQIIYRAGIRQAEKIEKSSVQLETYLIKKGTYLSKIVPNWRENIPQIGGTFDLLWEDEKVDKQEDSIEHYQGGDDMICMVRMKEPTHP